MFPLKNTLNKTPITDKQNNSPLWIAKELTKNQVHNKLLLPMNMEDWLQLLRQNWEKKIRFKRKQIELLNMILFISMIEQV